MLIEIHMLKNYPPVNLNRDDGGAPKTCFFGGVQRGRVSSQCLKRSWRTSDIFRSLGSFGIRTRTMPALVGERLAAMGVSPEFVEEAEKKLTGVANKEGTINKKGSMTTQIVFYSDEEIARITDAVKAAIDQDGTLKAFKDRKPKEFDQLKACAKDRPITADIALFGRMVTSDYFADVDAAMQVAHAISTHAVNRESDYFTAVDDLLGQSDDSTGAGMIGDVDYNSCCYYEYAALDTDILRENLNCCPDRESLIAKLIPVLLRAMAYTNPSGKQNTFAGQVLPDAVMVECKKDKIPLSYVNAFEEPVSAWGNRPDLVKNSVKKLAEHVDCMDHAYELPVLHRAFFAPRHAELHPASCEQFSQFSSLARACAEWLEEDDRP
ncbi:MAG: type I-E CRISPR-associated protein Cas7/Cse4/CasC [Clostridia bacterium]|nr:type I-E CRISPR-associated protein Cas7/Cse4/CasC [Clostridia bacterium]